MTAINVNTGPFTYEKGTFEPEGALEYIGENPATPYGKGVYSALMLIGLSGQKGEEFEPEDVVELVKVVRADQTADPEDETDPGDPSASFILQRGLYRHKKKREVVEEDSLRVIILHLTDEDRDEFKENILAMAEELANEFDQEEVIVEFQNKGVTDEVFGVTA